MFKPTFSMPNFNVDAFKALMRFLDSSTTSTTSRRSANTHNSHRFKYHDKVLAKSRRKMAKESRRRNRS